MFSVSDLLFSVPDIVQTIEGGGLSCGWASCQQQGLSHLRAAVHSWLALPFCWCMSGSLETSSAYNPTRNTLFFPPSSCYLSSPISQSRARARAGRSEWSKTYLLPCRTWHLCEKDGSKQCNCPPFPSNVSELFQWLCKECGGCMEAAVQLGMCIGILLPGWRW